MDKELQQWLASEGIQTNPTPPYSPESNAVAERLNRSIGEGLRSILDMLPDGGASARRKRSITKCGGKNVYSH